MTARLPHPPDALPALGWLAGALLVAAGLLWQAGLQEPRGWDPAPRVDVQLDGEHYRLDHARLTRIERFTVEWLEAGDAEVREQWQERVDAELAAHFDRLHRRVPEVADWYYSLPAEYGRLWLRAGQWLGGEDDADPARALRERLLPESQWETPLHALAERMEWGIDDHQRQVRDAWRVELGRELATARIPGPPPAGATDDAGMAHGQALYGALDADFERLDQRAALSAGVAAGSGIATPLIARAVQARLAVRAGQAGAARGLARAGRAGAAGTGLCAWAGPFSAGCGVAAAGVTLVATDWALLRADEARHRADLEAALHDALDALHADTRERWQEAVRARVEARHAASRQQIEHGFRPLRTAVGDDHREPR